MLARFQEELCDEKMKNGSHLRWWAKHAISVSYINVVKCIWVAVFGQWLASDTTGL